MGVSRDPEFYEPTIFIKHKPSLKLNFYSPIGESDLTYNDLNDKKKKEESAYQEFVVGNKKNGIMWELLPLILGQLILTILTFGLSYKNEFRLRKILIHYLINIVLLFAGSLLIFYFDKVWTTLVILGILLSLNRLTITLTISLKQPID